MSAWFVRANRGKTELNLPITDQRETTVDIGPIGAKIPFKTARSVAFAVKKRLQDHGWLNVRVVRIDDASNK